MVGVERKGDALLRQCKAGDWLALLRIGASHSESACNCFLVTTQEGKNDYVQRKSPVFIHERSTGYVSGT